MNSSIIFQGNFSNSDVSCSYQEVSSRKIDIDTENKAKLKWQETLKEAKEKGKKVWDQPVYRLEKYKVHNNQLMLDFSTIPFSIRSSIMGYTQTLLDKGYDYFPMATYSSIFIETSDGNFVFAEKSGQYMAMRKFTYIGGVFNRGNDVFNRGNDKNKQLDIFREALKEVSEELGLHKSDLANFNLLGAFRSETLNVGFIFYCKLNLSDKEVSEKFENKTDNELKKLFFVKRSKIRDFCVNKIGKEAEMVDIFEKNANN